MKKLGQLLGGSPLMFSLGGLTADKFLHNMERYPIVGLIMLAVAWVFFWIGIRKFEREKGELA